MTKKHFHRGGGGWGQLLNSVFVRSPCAAPIIPLQEGPNERVFSLLGQMLHCWVGQYDREKQEQTRALCDRSRNTPTKLSNAYLVKPRNLLPGPGEGEAEKSKSSDPHKTAHLFKYLGVETHDSVSPEPCDALGFEVSLGEDVP